MAKETVPGLARHMSRMIPSQVVGMDREGNENIIGTFNAGVVLQGSTILDVISREIIASYSMRDDSWVVSKRTTRRYKYIFIQTQPQ